MTLHRARVLKAAEAATPVASRGSERSRVIPGQLVRAREEAARLLEAARQEAVALVAEAEARGRTGAAAAAEAAREEAVAALAAGHLALRAREETLAARELDRTVEIAVLLAERMIGEALAIEPARIAALATEALRETRGARRRRLAAAPADGGPRPAARVVRGHVVAEIAPNPELGRGSVLVETELGQGDARLAPRLERLARALREALAEGHAKGPAGIGGSR